MKNNNTDELDKIINNINSENDIDKFIKNQLSSVSTLKFHEYIDDIRISKKIKKSTLVADSEINRTYCYQILNGTKNPSRDNVIKIALACNLSLVQANKALTLAGFNKLYSKDVRDSLIIYFINNCYSVVNANIILDKYQLSLLGNRE